MLCFFIVSKLFLALVCAKFKPCVIDRAFVARLLLLLLLPGGLFHLMMMNHCSKLRSFRDPADTNSLAVRGEGALVRETFFFPPLWSSMLLVISGICCPTLAFTLCCHLKSFAWIPQNPWGWENMRGGIRSGGGVHVCGGRLAGWLVGWGEIYS